MILPMMTLLAQFGEGLEPVGTGVFDPGTTTVSAGQSLQGILSLIIGFLTVIAGVAFMIYFLIGALNWTTAGGDQGRVDTAKKNMTNGAIGLIIIVVSYGIIAVVGEVLGLKILDPASVILRLNP